MTRDEQQQNPGEKVPSQQERKRYMTPQLSEYGHVAKLTQGAGSGAIDVDLTTKLIG